MICASLRVVLQTAEILFFPRNLFCAHLFAQLQRLFFAALERRMLENLRKKARGGQLVHGAFNRDMSGTLSRALSWTWLRSTH